MSIRKQIIERFNRTQRTVDLYETMKSCIVLNPEKHSLSDIDLLDDWFDGVITSLFYRPNNKAICFVGKAGIGKTYFFKNLLPQREWLGDSHSPEVHHPNIYQCLIADMTDFDTKQFKKVLNNDGFLIGYNNVIKKRLASLCYTSNIERPEFFGRKNILVFHIESIDIIKFNSIDKHSLWIEIYNRFLEKHRIQDIFTQGDIDQYFDNE